MSVEIELSDGVAIPAHVEDTAAAPAKRRGRFPRLRLSAWVAIGMLSVIFLLIVAVPFWSHFDPYSQNLANGSLDPFTSGTHPLGTDPLGRDVLSRLSLAGRVSVLIAFCVVLLSILIGVVLGMISGYVGGIVDSAIMGLADFQLTLPLLLLLIAVIAAVGPSITTLVVVLAVSYWIRYGRVARVVTLTMRKREFVLASVTFGGAAPWILRRHVFPQLRSQLIVMGSFDLGVIVSAEAALSYLGLGVQAPTPSWGSMIFDGQSYLQIDAWLCILPGIAVFLLLGGIQILSQSFTFESAGSKRRRRRPAR